VGLVFSYYRLRNNLKHGKICPEITVAGEESIMSSASNQTTEKTSNTVIQVCLFGSLELENHHGIAVKPLGAEQILFWENTTVI